MKKTVLVVVVLFTMLGCSDESDMGKLFMKKTEGLTFGIERYYVKIIGGTPMVIKFNGDICSHPDELKVIGHTEDQLKLEGVFIPEYIGGRPPKNTTFVINIFLKSDGGDKLPLYEMELTENLDFFTNEGRAIKSEDVQVCR